MWLSGISIPKNSERIVKQGGSKKVVRYKLPTLNKIMVIAEADSRVGSIERFSMSKNIDIIEDNKFYKIKLNLQDCEDEDALFIVHNYFRPTVYLKAYETKKPPATCEVCGKPFNRKGSAKTCGSIKCSEELKKQTTYRYNHNAKKYKTVI